MLVPLTVADCMARDAATIDRGATVAEAARALVDAAGGSLVVTAGERPVGVVTETDLLGLLADGDAAGARPVEAVMAADPATIGPDAPVERAAELLAAAAGDRDRLPVVADGALVGVLSRADLADYHYLPRLAGRRGDRGHPGPDDRLPSPNPEMAYDLPAWEFEGADTADGVGVGDVVRFRKELSDADVRAFAAASGDTNRLHLDDEFAAGTRFGGRIVHGVLVAGLLSAALARLPGLTIYLGQDLRFLGPVPVDTVATAVCRVREALGGGKFRLDLAVYDDAGDRAVEGEAVVLVDDLPEGAEPAE